VSGPNEERREDAADRALDAALAMALRAPHPRQDFRARLIRTLGNAQAEKAQAEIESMELEYRSGLAALDRSYVRIRRRTLGMLIGGGLVIGAALPLILSRLQSDFGPRAQLVIALASAAIGVGIAWLYPTQVFIAGVRTLEPVDSLRTADRF
jgi:hypothetical protein